MKQQCETELPGTEETAVKTGPGKGKAAMLELDRRGTGVAAMSQSCSLVDQSRKAERSQEVRRGPQGKRFSQGRRNGNPNRELVKRKQSSDCGRRIRKRVRQLTRASKGRHGALAYRANPTEVWNKAERRRKGSRMWRLAGGERSTRFESASQYSQLPLQAEQSRKTEES